MRITAPPLPRHPGSSAASSSASRQSSRDLESSGSGTARHRNVRSLSPAPSPRSAVPTPTPTPIETTPTIPATATATATTRSGAPRRHNSASNPKLAAYMSRYQEGATTTTNQEQDPTVKEELAALSGITKEKGATFMKKTKYDVETNPTLSKEEQGATAPTKMLRRMKKKTIPANIDQDPRANEGKVAPSTTTSTREKEVAPWMKKTKSQDRVEKDFSKEETVTTATTTTIGKKVTVVAWMKKDSGVPAVTENKEVSTIAKKQEKVAAPWMKKDNKDERREELISAAGIQEAVTPRMTRFQKHVGNEPAPTTSANIVAPVRRIEKKATWMQRDSEDEVKNRVANKDDTSPAPTSENIVAPVRRKVKKAPWMQKNSEDEGKVSVANNLDGSPPDAVAVKRKEKLAPWMTKNQVDPDGNSSNNNDKAENDAAVISSVPVKTGTVAALAKKQTEDVSKTSSTKTKKAAMLSPVFTKGTVASLTKKPSKEDVDKPTTLSTTVVSQMEIKKGTVASLTRKQKKDDSDNAPTVSATVVSTMVIKKGTVASLTRTQRKEDADKPTSVVPPPARKTIVAPWMKEQSTVEKPTRNSVGRERRKMKRNDATRGVEPNSVIEPNPALQTAQQSVAPADATLAALSISNDLTIQQQQEHSIIHDKTALEFTAPDALLTQEPIHSEEQLGGEASPADTQQQEREMPEFLEPQNNISIPEPVQTEGQEEHSMPDSSEKQHGDTDHDEQSKSSLIPDKSRSQSLSEATTNDEPGIPSSSAHFLSTGLENSIGVLDLALGESFVVAAAEQDEEEEVAEDGDNGEDDEDDDDGGGNSSSEGGNGSPRNDGLRDSAESTCSFDLSLGTCEEVSSIGEEEEIEVEILEYIIEDISVDGEEKIDLHMSKNVADLELRKMFSKANIGFDMDDMSDLDEMTEIPDETEVNVDDARADSGSPVLGEKARSKGVSNDFSLASPSPPQGKGKLEIIGFVSPGRQQRNSSRSLHRTSDVSVQSEYSEYVLEESEVDLEYVDEEEIVEEEDMEREVVLEEEDVTEVECDEETEAEDGSPLQGATT